MDYNLEQALFYHPQDFLPPIQKVLAVWEGEADGPDWVWIIQFGRDHFAGLIGGCDYTGWDCQSYLKAYETSTVEDAIEAVCYDYYSISRLDMEMDLYEQAIEGRKKTWREKMDKEFGITD